MSQMRVILFGLISFMLATASWVVGQERKPSTGGGGTLSSLWVEGKGLTCGIDRTTGVPTQVTTHGDKTEVNWLRAPVRLNFRNESTNVTAEFRSEENTSELQSLRHLVCR